MEQEKIDKILKRVLTIFLIIQPLCDIYMAVVGERLDILGFSIVTLLRIITVAMLLLFVAIKQIKFKYHIKSLCGIITYIIIVGIYALLHHFNIVNSNGYYISQGIYSILTEMLYVMRLIVPVLLLYVVVILKPNKEEICKIATISAGIIATVIVVTNLLKVSYNSYPQTNKTISYTLFDWFGEETIPYNKSLSKGLFVSANQIGALLVLLLPMVMYYTVKKNKWYYYLLLLFQVVSMILVGTRVASYGWLIVTISFALIYAFLILFKARKKPTLQALLNMILIFEVGLLLYVNSPAMNRQFAESYEGMYDDEIVEKGNNYIELSDFKEMLKDEDKLAKYLGDKNVKKEDLKYNAMCKYILESYKYQFVSEKYIKTIYPYTDDPEFWLDVFSEPIGVKGDNRGRQIAIIHRIKANNNNMLLDTLLGMGATPLNQREYMIENDIISHYYNLGIIGIILFVIPYIFGIIYSLWLCRKNFSKIFSFKFLIFSLSICLTYFTGYFAGHVLDEYIISIYLAVVSGVTFNYFREDGQKLLIE